MHKICRVAGLATALTGLLGVAFAQDAAAPAAATQSKIGWVDLEKVNDQYSRLQSKRDELKMWFNQQEDLLRELASNYLFLSEELFNEALAILQKPRPLSAPDATRQQELKQFSDEKENRFLELEPKTDRTPREQEEFNGLQELAQARNKQIEALAQNLQRQLVQMQSSAEEELTNNMRAVVEQLATERGFSVVLNKLGVLYGGEDITAAVIERLNGAAPTAPAPAPAPAGGQ